MQIALGIICVTVYILQRISLETDLHETVSMLLADSLRVLLEHGLLDNGKPVTFTGACFPAWRGRGQSVAMSNSECPAWQVFKHYYKVKVCV